MGCPGSDLLSKGGGMAIAIRSSELASVGTEGLNPRVVEGRECGTCTLCCKVAAVEEMEKPNGVWCSHCVAGKRCTIYDQRPPSCRTFYCQWMLEKGLGPEWKPERAKFALVKTEGGKRISALVDPGFPSAWRHSPYYENLKHWAAEAARRLPDIYLVDVIIGQRNIVILPDREVELGVLEHDEALSLTCKNTATGPMIEVCKIKRPAESPRQP
jgi:Fe-S-cluster containining protein